MSWTMDPKVMNAKRGEGFGSRLWCKQMICRRDGDSKRTEKKFCIWFDDQRKHYKSSKEVQVTLHECKLLEADKEGSATATDASEYATKKYVTFHHHNSFILCFMQDCGLQRACLIVRKAAWGNKLHSTLLSPKLQRLVCVDLVYMISSITYDNTYDPF